MYAEKYKKVIEKTLRQLNKKYGDTDRYWCIGGNCGGNDSRNSYIWKKIGGKHTGICASCRKIVDMTYDEVNSVKIDLENDDLHKIYNNLHKIYNNYKSDDDCSDCSDDDYSDDD